MVIIFVGPLQFGAFSKLDVS